MDKQSDRATASRSRPKLLRNGSRARTLRGVDLYSGIGGWSLGLAMAGIKTLASFEWWDEANRTHERNFGAKVIPNDVRKLDRSELPGRVDIVVGSPPCTEFSFANRGGSGDIDEGLKDIRKFLQLVSELRPQSWAMENVPRVARILERELGVGGRLREFAPLVKVITVVDAAHFGLPQGRKRMIAGDFPLSLLLSYSEVLPRRALADVVYALNSDPVTDPIYGLLLPRTQVTGMEVEPPLAEEEIRMNSEAKRFHPVYNNMSFPDRLDRPARTVTATCTRVSRESIVIADPRSGVLRRLTLRERACLQGFPITFQFYGETYQDDLKMVGNAIPPLLTYYIGHAIRGTAVDQLPPPAASQYLHPLPSELPAARSMSIKTRYPPDRRFRAAIPNLRFGSGVRFELVNEITPASAAWRVDFYFGTSKRILRQPLTRELWQRTRAVVDSSELSGGSAPTLTSLESELRATSSDSLQKVWAHRAPGMHPHKVVDALGKAAFDLRAVLDGADEEAVRFTLKTLARAADGSGMVGEAKLRRHAATIFVGLLLGSWFNSQSPLARARHSLSIAV